MNNTLTWNNVGYRFGVKLGHLSDIEINEVYDFLAQQYLITNTTLTSANNTLIFPNEIEPTEIFIRGQYAKSKLMLMKGKLKPDRNVLSITGVVAMFVVTISVKYLEK